MSYVVVSAAVEGSADEAVIRRLIEHAGGHPGPVYGKNGKEQLRQRIAGYNSAAKHSPWAVLVDLNHETECAPLLLRSWNVVPAPKMCLRVVVREIEAWLLADRPRLAAFLQVGSSRIPAYPESVEDPKLLMVNIARRSRSRAIREDMVPRPGSGRAVGPAYASRLIEFVAVAGARWRPDVAARHSESLNSCIRCLRRLVSTQV